ncbi:MAG: hypothetical protein NWQ54_03480 [Paraglaciecola sp.]|nr:hypothetical protein [Paraglaciecola sp.]
MLHFIYFLLLGAGVILGYKIYALNKKSKRLTLIEQYSFPLSISTKVGEQYPQLSQSDLRLVIKGLREYFHVCNLAGRKPVSMPSQVIDVAWHEFILFTRQYDQFCSKAFGRFLHHTPAEAMKSPTMAQKGIKTAWRFACQREGLPPKQASRLPLLFAIDAKLNIRDGFHYRLNCQHQGKEAYCASHIGCSGCSGGFSACSSDVSCSGGCSGD